MTSASSASDLNPDCAEALWSLPEDPTIGRQTEMNSFVDPS